MACASSAEPGFFHSDGLRMDRLEIPDHYLRDAGMESYAEGLWQSLKSSHKAYVSMVFGVSSQATEANDPTELAWWASGAIEAVLRTCRSRMALDCRWNPPTKLFEKMQL